MARMPKSRCQNDWLQTAISARSARGARATRSRSPFMRAVSVVTLLAMLVSSSGCTSIRDYVRQGFRVGPDYHEPPAAVAPHWIDANDKRVNSNCEDITSWWKVFKDPALDALICTAYHQNLTLREAGFRILQAR